VTVKTGSGAITIQVLKGFSWTSTSRLTLDANQSVIFRKPVTVAGSGAITLTYNDGGSAGDLLFEGGGSLQFWDLKSHLVINSASFALVGDVATLASEIAANPAGHFALAKSYDAQFDGTYTSPPVSTEFAGTFSGLGNSVSNLVIRARSNLAGFFSTISESGQVRDFGLRHARLTTIAKAPEQMVLGILAGENRGIVDSSFATGTIKIESYIDDLSVGGLVGRSVGQIVASHAKVEVMTAGGAYYNRLGGLLGLLDGSTNHNAAVVHSDASGRVQSPSVGFVGGLVGQNFQGTVAYSHAVGAVVGGQKSRVGGLIGNNAGNIEGSFANGALVTGSGRSHCYAAVGGLVGTGYYGLIENSYATGSVIGGDQACVGGLIGHVWGKTIALVLTTSYSVGAVSGGAAAEVGGAIGREKTDLAHNSDSYWDTDSSGTTQAVGNTKNRLGLKGLSTEELVAHLPEGFDNNIWGQSPNINGGYPYLLANLPPK
jgi:hypothetical protein